MEDLANLAIQRFVLPVFQLASNPSWLLGKASQLFQSFQTTFFQSDSSEQILLLLFTIVVLVILTRLAWIIFKAIVSFCVEVAKYLLFLVVILVLVQWRAEVKEMLEPFLQRFYAKLN